ncbi:MAG: hypothetical protein FWD82_04240 [Defluviitaleaceae bacterium]|nr:hypothetical protein [Defluviitaleaceae bacterium]
MQSAIDLASDYENKPYLSEILDICVKYFYDIFKVSRIVTKAIPQAINRVEALYNAGFIASDFNGRKNYYLRSRF